MHLSKIFNHIWLFIEQVMIICTFTLNLMTKTSIYGIIKIKWNKKSFSLLLYSSVTDVANERINSLIHSRHCQVTQISQTWKMVGCSDYCQMKPLNQWRILIRWLRAIIEERLLPSAVKSCESLKLRAQSTLPWVMTEQKVYSHVWAH